MITFLTALHISICLTCSPSPPSHKHYTLSQLGLTVIPENHCTLVKIKVLNASAEGNWTSSYSFRHFVSHTKDFFSSIFRLRVPEFNLEEDG